MIGAAGIESGEAQDLSGSDLIKKVSQVRSDPWYFLSRCVFTLDETDKKNPIKKFPSEGTMGRYLKLYTRVWQSYPYLLVPKSRRMFMTWINVALYLHDTMWHIGRSQAFMSKKEDDADGLLLKAKFILDHIPPEEIPRDLLPKYDHVFCELRFPELNSKIMAFPQGPDQLRTHTISGILADEFAFWDRAQETYAAAIPTIEGGGRFTGISSPGPGFFKRMVHDQLDNDIDDDGTLHG